MEIFSIALFLPKIPYITILLYVLLKEEGFYPTYFPYWSAHNLPGRFFGLRPGGECSGAPAEFRYRHAEGARAICQHRGLVG